MLILAEMIELFSFTLKFASKRTVIPPKKIISSYFSENQCSKCIFSEVVK